MSTTISVAFFVCTLALAGTMIWRLLMDNMSLMQAMASKHRTLQRADFVTVTVLAAPRYVAAPPPDFRQAAQTAVAFGRYEAAPTGADHRASQFSACAAVGKWSTRPLMKTGTQWHRPYLPRGIAARPNYRFEPCFARDQAMSQAAVA